MFYYKIIISFIQQKILNSRIHTNRETLPRIAPPGIINLRDSSKFSYRGIPLPLPFGVTPYRGTSPAATLVLDASFWGMPEYSHTYVDFLPKVRYGSWMWYVEVSNAMLKFKLQNLW